MSASVSTCTGGRGSTLGAMTQYCVRTAGVGTVWASVQNSAQAFTGALDDRVEIGWELTDVHVFSRGADVLTGEEPTTMAVTDA